ncbi:MAG: hypothetical protein M3Y27_12480 [Acidobacteriota bacterium]|nr:hypothetical protein [Pseudomonadota bacterium]MDQ2946742.1 hypothetical protein [Acidobacteriota bacterium]
MEAPNTVAGLVRKRAELAAFRKGLEGELHKVTCDLDHLDAAIALFDPEATPRAVKRYATKHRAKKGTVRRFVLTALREATGPITSAAVTEAWIAARGLHADQATFVILRKRIGACLTTLRVDGLATGAEMVGEYKGWLISAHKDMCISA